MYKTIKIFGINFIDADYKTIKKKLDKGGLLVLPSGPGLATINNDKIYYDSVKKADLVLLAMGFMGPQQKMLDKFLIEKDQRGNAQASTEGDRAYFTSRKKVFAAGDMRRGQSLVVWAIREGRQCARAVDEFLMGTSVLPR